MSSYYLCPVNWNQIAATGAPLSGGTVSTYLAGSSTPAATYTSNTGNTQQTNPIVLNTRGIPPSPIWMLGGQAMKFVIEDANGVLVQTIDGLTGINDFTTLAATSGASLVGFIQSGASAVAETAQAELRRLSICPEQFGAAAVYSAGVDETTFVQACMTAAQGAGRAVRLNRYYRVGNLLFGSQSTTGQSTAPAGLIGNGTNTGFVAVAGTTGTLLKSWSVAGVTFRDFEIDVSGTAAMAWDCEWKPGAGPSTQNVIENITVQGGTAATLVNLKNLNDTFPDRLIVNATAHSQCCIDMTQSGGLASIQNSIWNGGFLRFGCQNGSLVNSWGMGIEWAQLCLNHVLCDGLYLYANSTHDAVMWSQSFSSSQSVGSLKATACQFITVLNAVSAFFNLNAYSTLDFDGCEFTGTTANLMGASSRSDSFATVPIRIRGGSAPGTLTLNEPTGFYVEAQGFMNTSTGVHFTKSEKFSFTPTVYGGSVAGATGYTLRTGVATRQGNEISGTVHLTWTTGTGTGAMFIGGFPYTQDGSGSVTLDYFGSTFTGLTYTQITASIDANIALLWSYDGKAGGGATAVPMQTSGDIALGFRYLVTN